MLSKRPASYIQQCFLFFASFIACNFSFSQSVGIGTNLPNANAKLDIMDSSRGILIPRMDSNHRKNIPNTTGLMVYDTSTRCFWFNNGTSWINFPASGNVKGDMMYWNGNQWSVLPAGLPGQYLQFSSSTLLPAWAGVAAVNIITSAPGSITQNSAISGGNITSDGGASITARGVVWSTTTNPLITLPTKTLDGSGMGTYSSTLTGLLANTIYYLRAYATNANGTSYGNQLSFTSSTGTFTLGQSYGGGIIFYIDGSGQHGLIAAPEDQSIGITWSPATGLPPLTNATGLAIGTGAANTTTIINIQGAGSYAASLCRNFYSGGGFNDWFLPSLYELNQLFLHKNLVPGLSSPLYPYYWTSSEVDVYNAWAIDFNSPGPNQINYSKSNPVSVRAIRTF